MRYVHLQKKLQDKVKEMEELNWREKQILAGVYKNPCGTPLGGPCLAVAASTVCCFCPSHLRPNKSETTSFEKEMNTAGTNILYTGSEFEEAKLQQVLQQRSKSVKVSEKEKGKAGEPESSSQYYYDCYRKCQSSRELSSKDTNNPFNRISNQSKDAGSSSTNKLVTGNPSQSRSTEPVKPKSWDNLIGTKSFGGYGYGFGYGYFPSNKDVTQQHGSCSASHHVTHPHHHNHHSHCTHSHSNSSGSNSYYYNQQSSGSLSKGPRTDTSRQKVKVVYNYVAPTYHTMLPNDIRNSIPCTSTSTISKVLIPTKYSAETFDPTVDSSGATHRSKTLPLKKNASAKQSPSEPTFSKLEKTFSDSSLSDHHKEFPKTMSYFKRSGDNVRFSSDEEYEMYGLGSKDERITSPGTSSAKKEKEHIFV